MANLMTRLDSDIPSLRDERLNYLLKLGCQTAIEAGSILQILYDNPHQVHLKGAIDLVTEADLASEKKILELLREKTPEVSILSEESAADFLTDDHTGPCWVVDPLDGTTNYAHGFRNPAATPFLPHCAYARLQC